MVLLQTRWLVTGRGWRGADKRPGVSAPGQYTMGVTYRLGQDELRNWETPQPVPPIRQPGQAPVTS